MWDTTNLSRRLDSFDETEEDDGPGEQKTQSHLPAHRAKVMDALTEVLAQHVATADGERGHLPVVADTGYHTVAVAVYTLDSMTFDVCYNYTR